MKKIKSIVLFAAMLLLGISARAQFSFAPLTVVNSNAWTYWNPSNVLGTFQMNPHLVQIQAANFGTSNTLTIPIRMGIDGALSNYPVTFFTFTNNALFSNNVTGLPVGSNGTYLVYIPAQTINVYGSAIIQTTNTTASTLQVGVQLIY